MPKKNPKSALKKKQKKQKSKPKPKQLKENEKDQNQNNDNNNNANLHLNKEVLELINDSDKKIKEFVRDIALHNFSLPPIDGGPLLIRGCNIKLVHGHRYGLIGNNGAGKTTFLKKLASGTMKEIPKYLNILHVSQELEGTELTVIQTVLKSDKERELLLAEEKRLKQMLDTEENETKQLELTESLNKVNDRLKFIEADKAVAKASDILDNLGFTDRMKNMKTSDLSGGWRMRVSLSCALFIEPDVLLLDEPTNHLDFPTVIWLTEYLTLCYPTDKTLVIVSHDRRFLNDVCTDILHLNYCRLRDYTGNYDSFLRIRSQSEMHQRKQYERQQKMIKHNQDFIARFKANKKWSTQAQSRMKLLNRVQKIEAVLKDLEFRFSFPKPPPLKNPLLFHLDNVSFSYFGEKSNKGTYILQNVNIRLEFGEKIGILGANGAGKSTLLKLIMNELKPIKGTAALTNAVEIGYFAQHHLLSLDYNATPLEHLKNVFGKATIQEIYAQLGRFMLGDQYARRKISTLSGGQKSRVVFSILTWYSPHLIIMDEPTNHLDMATIDALAIALSDFDGAVIVVSHDQHFVETVCDKFWCVGNRSVKVFDEFSDCRKYSQHLKQPDVLPREFSTHSSGIKNKEYFLSVGGRKSHNPHIAQSQKNKNNVSQQKNKNDIKEDNDDIWSIDPEREIDKGLRKGLTPNQILLHIKGWKPKDGNTVIVSKLAFILFHDYFDDNNDEPDDHNEFFKKWMKLICYCIPLNHKKNQYELINIAVKCFITALKDKKKRSAQSGFVIVLADMQQTNMVSMEILKQWYLDHIDKDNAKKKKKPDSEQMNEALKQMNTCITMLEEDDDESEDSD